MKLTTEKFEINTNKQGQVSSIIFEGKELLHDGSQWWKKTFPIIWPVVGVSTGFEVDGIDYKIPKHGFMKDLEWDGYVVDNKITLMSTFIKNEIYPFSIDINIRIWAEDNQAFIESSFGNISKREAFFHFGYHPAFKIDETSIIKSPDAQAVSLEGKFMDQYFKQEKLIDMDFGKKYDTLVSKNIDFTTVEYNYDGMNIEIGFDSPNIQYWKPSDAMFVCIEPWWGAGDMEKEIISKAEDKDGIIKLPSGQTWKGTMSIKIK